MQQSAAAEGQRNLIPALPFCHVRLSGPKPLPKGYPKHFGCFSAKCGLGAGGFDALGGLFDKRCDSPGL